MYLVQQKTVYSLSVCIHVASRSLNVQGLTAKNIGAVMRENMAPGFLTRP